ncbi:hypothetical protein Gotur_016673 [Gossypium turneri]
MAKDILFMQTWGEVAPALLISRQRSSSSPRLETIVEEERGGVRLPKRVIVVLPILLSLSLYALLTGNIKQGFIWEKNSRYYVKVPLLYT